MHQAKKTAAFARRVLATGISALAIGCASAALAQDATAAPQDADVEQNSGVLMQDIVVTANKRQEKLQDVGIAATAFSGETLKQLGVTNTSDLAKITPGLNVNYTSPNVTILSIRGVSQNDFADHLETPIAVYQDEGYVGTAAAIGVPTFDLERVEVLRGPQGTLFGRNATGGLMHFISAAPTDTFSGYAQASYGRFDTWSVEGAVSGPLADGVLGRLSFIRNKSDGPYTNIVTGRHDAGDTDNWAVRGQLALELGSQTSLRLLGAYYNDDQHGTMFSFSASKADADGLGSEVAANELASWPNLVLGGTVASNCAGCNILGYNDSSSSPWISASNYPGYYRRDIYKGQARLTHDFGATTLTLISDYLKVDKEAKFDADMSPTNFFIYGANLDYRQFSQELRLNGEAGNLKWVTGLYYLNMRGDYVYQFDLDFAVYVGAPLCSGVACGPGSGAVPVHFESLYSLNTDSVAGFAQGEYELSSELSLTGGLRYTHDKKRFIYDWSNVLPFTAAISDRDKRKFENVAAKLQVDWRPANGTLVYLGYNRGHKGGNWSAPAFPPIDVTALPHKQEVLTSYETGVKTKLFGRLATLNVSTYYYDYHNYQAFSLAGLVQAIANRDARVIGAEAELRIAPARGLEMSLNGTVMDSKVKNVLLPSGRLTSREMPNAAHLQMSGLIRYGWDFAGGEMSLQASGKYMGKHYLSVFNEQANLQKAYATLDLMAGWQSPDGKLKLSVYGQNVTGTVYRSWSLDASALSLNINAVGPRSSYGANIRYNF